MLSAFILAFLVTISGRSGRSSLDHHHDYYHHHHHHHPHQHHLRSPFLNHYNQPKEYDRYSNIPRTLGASSSISSGSTAVVVVVNDGSRRIEKGRFLRDESL